VAFVLSELFTDGSPLCTLVKVVTYHPSLSEAADGTVHPVVCNNLCSLLVGAVSKAPKAPSSVPPRGREQVQPGAPENLHFNPYRRMSLPPQLALQPRSPWSLRSLLAGLLGASWLTVAALMSRRPPAATLSASLQYGSPKASNTTSICP
jgi:hypothetical protein